LIELHRVIIYTTKMNKQTIKNDVRDAGYMCCGAKGRPSTPLSRSYLNRHNMYPVN
jgi:hypothetical protein